MAGVLFGLAKSCKMPDKLARALSHIAEILQHIKRQKLTGDKDKSLPELLKDLQSNLSSEMDRQAAESLKASINDMGNSIVQVTDTSTQLASTATNYKDAILKSSDQPCHCAQESTLQADPRILWEVDRKAH
ncbi:hypothetical protein V8E53_013856 [Lactarius tabidus]